MTDTRPSDAEEVDRILAGPRCDSLAVEILIYGLMRISSRYSYE